MDHKREHRTPPTRGGLRLLGAPGWNLERGPISNEEEGGGFLEKMKNY